MVHDLRSPLTVVKGVLDLVGGDPDAADPEHPLQLARRSTERVLDLLTGILDVHRLEKGKMPLSLETFDLTALAGEVVASLRPLAEAKAQHLSVESPGRSALVHADRGLLARVIQNLVGNAIKFTPPAGLIRATVKLEPAEARVAVSVTDDGPGVASELQPQLFQEFVTGPLRERGSGLGLAFCRLAIEAHGGSIRVESEPGHGATFTFTLPVAAS
jgi:signal transduction histidine kinase